MSLQSEITAAQGPEQAAGEYRMIAFSLAGRDYGIDIMAVKEISREGRFTYVPNTAPFVLGVHNLRGEIIPVIDLRRMFGIPAALPEEGVEQSMLILRLPEFIVGIVVDSIDGVRSAPRDAIQPPHPIFGEINMQYISGVLERDGRLYVLLDVERIFSRESQAPSAPAPASPPPSAPTNAPEAGAVQAQSKGERDLRFVCESLAALAGFHATAVNMPWVERRFSQWKAQRSGASIQLKTADDAREFLTGFATTGRSELWEDAAREALMSLVPGPGAGGLLAWNHGCGRGFAAYSLACALKAAFPGAAVKIWASDRNLVEIAAAPTLTLPAGRVPAFYREHGFTREVPGGLQMAGSIREAVIFEYTESLYRAEGPAVDIVVCQDVLSFHPPETQKRLLDAFMEKLRPEGILVLGANEQAAGPGWLAREKGGVHVFAREMPKE
jgi:chemotaxis signal transduction protein/chemotaxis methyl-accepting protein methylase